MFGKPFKILLINSVKVPIYKAKVFYGLMGKNRYSLWKAQKNGLIPPPQIVKGNIKYYSQFELLALSEVNRKHGLIRLDKNSRSWKAWYEDLTTRWKEIHTAVKEGRRPEVPLAFSFSSMLEFEKFMESVLTPYGVHSQSSLNKICQDILFKANPI